MVRPPVFESNLANVQAYVFPVSEPSYAPILNTNLARPVVAGRSAVVYDVRSSRFLFSKNSAERLPIASVTKLMSAVIVLENMALNQTVKIGQEAIRVDGEKQTLYRDEVISVGNLLKMMLIESSNDAAYALAQHADRLGFNFIDAMNRKAIEIGMADTTFKDPAGLNDEGYSTAEDLIKLVTYSFNYPEMWSILGEQSTVVLSTDGKIVHPVQSTNQLFGVVPDIVGGKTGYTDLAKGCMVLVVDVPGRSDKMISIVLGSTERFNDTDKLIAWARSAYRWR